MGRSKLAALTLVAFAGLAAPHVARAQGAQDKAAAEAAFEDGKRLMNARAFADACGKFAESQRLDPGIGTMLGLADCYEKNGQTASAWAEFREAASAASRKGDKREALARENATRLEPLLSKLVIAVPPGADVRGLGVKRDGVDLGRASWGQEVPIDPGVHAVSASAPGKREWQVSIEIAAKPAAQTVTVPRLEDAPIEPAKASADHAADDEKLDERRRTQRIVGASVAGAGVVALGFGVVFGLSAKGKLDDSNANGHCDASNACDGPGLDSRSSAKSAALVSTLGFVIGAAAVAGGAVIWLTAPHPASDSAPAPSTARIGLAPGAGGVAVVGAW